MPSTFTPSGVELIANGEQSGAWGDTTNVNLQIIDRMTSQAGTITLSGTTHTLSLSNGILSDGQYNVLVFAGSPSGTNTVTISPNTAQRTFFVRNTTTQSVVLSQGSGANVTVPTNTSKIVYTNGGGAGATVFDITNTIAANIVGNASTATALQTARTIGGVSFNGTANINLPGVNTGGNQNTTGSAATLTTARTLTIGSTGKTFNGSANVAWSLAEIGVNNATLTLATSGIATGSQTFTSNQGTAATFTVNVPATNLGYTTAASTGTVTSSTGTNATLPAATTSLAGLLTGADKTKLNGIAAGAQVNVATNLSVTGGTTAGPVINSSTGTNVTLPTASGTASGVVTTGAQTFAGVKTFSSTITGSVSGNAGTATTLQTARTIALSGAATGTATSFNGSANITIPVTGLNASNLNAGTVPDARLTGTYSDITLQTNGGNTHVTTPNSGSPSINDRTVFGLAQYKSDNSAQVGAIVFIAPDTTSTIMHRMKIEGMLYEGGPTVCTIIQGYRTTGAWSNTSKLNLGITDLQVRWGVTPDGKNCIILGDVGTSWSYPMLAITHAMFSHSGVTDAYCKDWTVATVTDLSLYTNVTANLANSVIHSGLDAADLITGTVPSARLSGTYGISVSGSAATLTTARTINGTSFNGSANITTANWGTARAIWGTSINGSANVTGPVRPAAGSVTAPAFSTSGDTNTGIYFSAADQMNVTTGGTLAATFAANGNFTAVGDVTAFSDIRLKKDLQPIPDALAKVMSLTGYTYERIDSGERQTGVVAQEVLEVLPEAVSLIGEHLSVAYGNMVGLLIEAIKELKAEVEDLKARLED